NHVFDAIAATAGLPTPWPIADDARPVPETVILQSVTNTFFDVLGVTPVLGRTFRPEDVTTGNVKVISERVWQSRFAADRNLVGRTIRLGSPGRSATVVGVVPDRAQILGTTDVWEVMGELPRTADLRGSHVLQAIARLKPDVTLDQARADMAVVAGNIERVAP